MVVPGLEVGAGTSCSRLEHLGEMNWVVVMFAQPYKLTKYH